MRAVLRGGRQPVEIVREAAERKGLFQRETFWDLLMEVTAAAAPTYAAYSYRDRADRYVREFTRAETDRLRAGAAAVRFSTLRERIQAEGFAQADLYVTR